MAKPRYTYIYRYIVSQPDYLAGKILCFKTQATDERQARAHFDKYSEGLEDDIGNPIEIEIDFLESSTDPRCKKGQKS